MNKPLVVYSKRYDIHNKVAYAVHNDKIIPFLLQKWDCKVILMSHDK